MFLLCQDGGDCLNQTDSRLNHWEQNRGHGGSSSSYTSSSRYCASGCPNNWVGDKVCDRSCKNAECAFDGGDCGIELIQENLLGIQLTKEQTHYEIPAGTISCYVNLTTLFPGTILEASHDNSAFVRSAIVTQHLRVLTIIMFQEQDIQGKTKNNSRQNKHFNGKHFLVMRLTVCNC